MGSTWQSFHFICDWWTKIDYLNFGAEIRLFENLKNLYCPDGWVGGWVGGDQMDPSILLILKYHNKQDKVIAKMSLSVAYAF